MFSERPRDHVAGAPPLSLCVAHFGELLEDGSSGQKARLIKFFAVRDGQALYSQKKQDLELTVAQIMNLLLPNSDLN